MTAQCAPYTSALKIFTLFFILRKFSGDPDYIRPRIGLLFRKFQWAFFPIDAVNMRTKFEVRSFTYS